jgi:hypothetical protein
LESQGAYAHTRKASAQGSSQTGEGVEMNECVLSALLVGFVAFICGGGLVYVVLESRFQTELRVLAHRSQQRYNQLMVDIYGAVD